MRYLGGKARIAQPIAELINNLITKHSIRHYIEPFCGGCWIAERVKAPVRSLSDVQPDLIMLWQALQEGWEPPDVSEKLYNRLKTEEPCALRGFAGFGCSFGGKFFGGYARSGKRNYASNARNSLFKKLANLKNAQFCCRSYDTIKPWHSLVYCDPPYASTTGYSMKFDSNAFWKWTRDAAKDNIVLVSEYVATVDVITLAEFATKTDMHCATGKEPRVEKVFMVSPQGTTLAAKNLLTA